MKNSVKNIDIKGERGFSDIIRSKNDNLMLPSQGINEKILKILNFAFEKCHNLKNNDKLILIEILESYKKIVETRNYSNSTFVLKNQEISEFLKLETKDVIRYILYRYKYNLYPDLKILEKYPPNIQVEITSVCNLRCVMCFQADKTFSAKSKGHMGFMKFDLFKKIIDEVEGNVEAVTFASRGEPTLHPELDRFLKYCNNKFLGLKLNTNATLLDEEKINTLLSSDLQYLVLSIDEKNKKNYEKIRVNADFDKIMKNLNLLKTIREKKYKNTKLKIRVSGVKINKQQDINDMNNFYKEFSDEVALVNYVPWESTYDNPINEIKETCSELYRRMFLWWDGKVNPCDYDYKSTLSKWNINNETISSVWNSKYYNNIRTLHNEKKRKSLTPCNKCLST